MFSFNSKPLSLLLYVVVFAASCYCLTTASKSKTAGQRRLRLFLAIVMPSILSCFRLCGADLALNSLVYFRVAAASWSEVLAVKDRPLYFIMMKLADALGGFEWFLFFLALIPCFCVCKTLYDSREKLDLSLAYTVFLFTCLVSSWNITRQFAAVGITCFAVRYVFSRELWKFLACVYLAYLFHPSCVVMLVVYPLWTKEQRLLNDWKLALYYMLAIVFVVNIASLADKLPGALGEEYNEYIVGAGQGGKNRDFFVNLLWLALFLYYRVRLRKFNPQNDLYLALFGLTCIIGLTGFFSPYIKRVALYFTVFQAFLIGSLPLALNVSERKILRLARPQSSFVPASGQNAKTFKVAINPSPLSGSALFRSDESVLRKAETTIENDAEESSAPESPNIQRAFIRTPTTRTSSDPFRPIPESAPSNSTASFDRKNAPPMQEVQSFVLSSDKPSSNKLARTLLYLAVFGLFVITAYILEQGGLIPYRHMYWAEDMGLD